MHAQLIRPERYGDPIKAFQVEQIDVPEIADDEVLVLQPTANQRVAPAIDGRKRIARATGFLVR